ncbi:MAG: lipoyl(octanoyl) transferase LipB [Candidatus Latescibacteria bacterium]|nr:lipoyl(octanoyl) transferase LipB [Candidatus Latescibacterota bacterium]
MNKGLRCWAGRLEYQQAWAWQQALRESRRQQALPDLLLLVEHPPTYTCGRSTRPEHLPAAPVAARAGIEVVPIERGGSITYHGPGQLVGYPILALHPPEQDLHRYVRRLEEVLIRALAGFGLQGRARPGLTGVWVGEQKVAAIGIHVRHWITMHGFALNVGPDLEYFRAIQPCGLDSRVITSMAALLPKPPALAEVAGQAGRCFAEVFGGDWEEVSAAGLSARVPLPGAFASPEQSF